MGVKRGKRRDATPLPRNRIGGRGELRAGAGAPASSSWGDRKVMGQGLWVPVGTRDGWSQVLEARARKMGRDSPLHCDVGYVERPPL